MKTSAVGPATQENTPQQEKAKADDGKKHFEKYRDRETGNKAREERLGWQQCDGYSSRFERLLALVIHLDW